MTFKLTGSVVASTALSLIAPIAADQQSRPASLAGRSTVYAPRGVIATSQPLATAEGLAVMQRGGNAIDAAVTAAAILAVVEPHMTGIGGDLFALVWSARDRNLHGLNASGRSGSLMTRETLAARGRERVTRGPESITIPGALSGWAALLETHGTLSLAEALAPAIRIADEGFPVTPIIARQWTAQENFLRRDKASRATFLLDGERAPRAGDWFRNPELAATLRQIAAMGPSHLYGGELGRRMAAHVQAREGFLTADDFAAHEAEWVQPVSVPFQGYRLWELPPNSQGIAALEMLRLLEPYDLKGMGHNSAAYLHHLIEAKKIAYADIQHYVGDPADMRVTPEQLLSDAFIDARRKLIDPARALPRVDPGDAATAGDTIYLAAADEHGNMVSLINSVFDYFGSGVVVPGTGVLLHDRGLGFTMTEGRANTVAPRRRPFHTIIPAFVTKTTRPTGVLRDASGEEPFLAFGVMGGAMQPQGHVQALLNILVFGMDQQQANDAARFRHLSGLQVAIESPVGDAVRAALAAMGHELRDESRTDFGGAQMVMKLPRGWAASSDPRKDGHASGR
ncbi:MAG TPA: gamma-glutamyltransferase family protein [Vicinamibacterales bacterium]|nr:gamma-glutamyltransferase family protein [Vicinamibacterales bacterium]